ncbi:DUF4032 domain-containing protein [Stieleria sp. JC731]|uniref:DUF4032 domain-containing protein n=1 Tax=Pirellulaceae TaxID=2691357 RepID=UPI001E5C20E5|nr:DUF4032 domain-containing protein [Stieleria sp. JC731]MCC9599241.1 DUF4032 domain-containing protein [Stieleria sp. JC731]
MQDSYSALSEEQVEEINRHKYFLSEQAGYDVGWDFAFEDWKENVAAPSEKVDAVSDAKPKNRIGGFLKRFLSRAAMM